jgi:hypothetical protein
MPTLNFNAGKNIIVPNEDNTTYRGLGDGDTYVISKATEKNSKIDIVDTSTDPLKDKNSVEISKNDTEAVIALRDLQKGITVLDLSFLDIDPGTTVEIKSHYWNGEGYDPQWYSGDGGEEFSTGIWNFFDIVDNSLVLAPETYFDFTNDEIFFEHTSKNDDGTLKDPRITDVPIRLANDDKDDDFKVKLTYTSNGEEKEYIVSFDSSFDDTGGENTIQLVHGITISSSLFTSNAARLTLSNGAQITISGADKFTYEVGGNITAGKAGDIKTFEEFSQYMGLEALPSSGSKQGNKDIIIEKRDPVKSDLSNFPLSDQQRIVDGESQTIDLSTYYIKPEGIHNATDLSLINDLSEIDAIEIDVGASEATVALKELKKGMEILDLSFLKIDEGSAEITKHYYNAYKEDIALGGGYDYWWWNAEERYNFTDLNDNVLNLAPESYLEEKGIGADILEYTEAKLWYEYTHSDGSTSMQWYPSQNFKVKIAYTSNGVAKEYIVNIDSIFQDDTDKSVYQTKIDNTVLTSLNYEIHDNSHPYFLRDQITLEGSQLTITGGKGEGELFTVEVGIRVSVVHADEYVSLNPADDYLDLTLNLVMTDDDYVKASSAIITESGDSETSITISEDTPGDVLLDLTNFNIDVGSAKIKEIAIGGIVGTSQLEAFYIDEKVLKFSEGAIYNYDSDQLVYLNYRARLDDGKYGYAYFLETENVRENDFEVIFTYTSNDEAFEHTLKIMDYVDTPYGSFDHSDYILVYQSETTGNTISDALFAGRRWPHLESDPPSYLIPEDEWTDYETIITYAFPDTDNNEIHGVKGLGTGKNYDPYNGGDTLHPFNDVAKNMYRDILDKTSKIFKITFKELSPENYQQAHLQFNLYTSTGSDGVTNYASFPGSTTSAVTLVGDESRFGDANWQDISPGGGKYGTAMHELGHGLGMSHPFPRGESYDANRLFTQMAYASFWDKDFDIYFDPTDNYYTSVKSISEIEKTGSTGTITKYTLAQPNWGRDDILTLGFLYGLRENYNNEDTVYSWTKDENIFETIHDMGGTDTIDLSNYDWNMVIDLNPGAVSEVGVGQERLHWDKSGSNSKTGDVFVLSWNTVIEKYIGSSGNDDVTLNTSVINDVSTGAGDDVIRDVLPTDIVSAGAGADTVYISYTTLDPNTSVSIDGGSETSDFDWIVCDLAPDTEKDFTLCRTAFVNFEGFDFTDNEKQTITLDSEDFVSINSQTLSIKGDSTDEVVLPEGATQTRSDDTYVYYSFNDVEIAISDDMMIG